MRPLRYYESEGEAVRASRWLERARIPAEVTSDDGRFVVRVPRDLRAEAGALLDRRARGPGPLPAGQPGRIERIFNVENALSIVFAATALLFAGIVVVGAFYLAIDLGVLASIVLLIAGLAYFHFSGSHGAVEKPDRVSPRTAHVQDVEVDLNYRRAWLREQLRKSDPQGP